MASYSLRVKASAIKELESLPLKDLARVLSRIEGLADNPRPPGCEKLTGQERYRVRQGDYRILYEVDDPQLTVTVVKVGHRREVYRSPHYRPNGLRLTCTGRWLTRRALDRPVSG